MKVVSVTEAKAYLSELLNIAEDELIVVTRKGRPTALLLFEEFWKDFTEGSS